MQPSFAHWSCGTWPFKPSNPTAGTVSSARDDLVVEGIVQLDTDEAVTRPALVAARKLDGATLFMARDVTGMSELVPLLEARPARETATTRARAAATAAFASTAHSAARSRAARRSLRARRA